MAASQGQYRRFLGRAIDVEGENGGFAAVERATSDLRSAIDGADVIIGGPVKDFNGVSGIGPAMAALLLGRRRGLAHRRWSELGEDRA